MRWQTVNDFLLLIKARVLMTLIHQVQSRCLSFFADTPGLMSAL